MKYQVNDWIRHIATGNLYVILGTPANGYRIEQTGEPAYAYQEIDPGSAPEGFTPDQTIWVRSQAETEQAERFHSFPHKRAAGVDWQNFHHSQFAGDFRPEDYQALIMDARRLLLLGGSFHETGRRLCSALGAIGELREENRVLSKAKTLLEKEKEEAARLRAALEEQQ